jgi:hypothetical protein
MRLKSECCLHAPLIHMSSMVFLLVALTSVVPLVLAQKYYPSKQDPQKAQSHFMVDHRAALKLYLELHLMVDHRMRYSRDLYFHPQLCFR